MKSLILYYKNFLIFIDLNNLLFFEQFIKYILIYSLLNFLIMFIIPLFF